MKRMYACLTIGLFLVGATGIAQAAGYKAGIDFQTEGPSYNYGSKKPIVHTVVALNQDSRYVEGMGFAPRDNGQKTSLSKVSDYCDFCSEGFTAEEIAMHFEKVNEIQPAAGN